MGPGPRRLDRREDRLGLHHHPRPAAVGLVVDAAGAGRWRARGCRGRGRPTRPAAMAFPSRLARSGALEDPGEDGEDVDPHTAQRSNRRPGPSDRGRRRAGPAVGCSDSELTGSSGRGSPGRRSAWQRRRPRRARPSEGGDQRLGARPRPRATQRSLAAVRAGSRARPRAQRRVRTRCRTAHPSMWWGHQAPSGSGGEHRGPGSTRSRPRRASARVRSGTSRNFGRGAAHRWGRDGLHREGACRPRGTRRAPGGEPLGGLGEDEDRDLARDAVGPRDAADRRRSARAISGVDDLDRARWRPGRACRRRGTT
ncbi:MAG: hypothetical protein KatS3mg014_1786 [Actinomycetota bacterium]|nr:MAG: hypothetical protein KatS3mg014_1786 [Actinomycetota bacterium]